MSISLAEGLKSYYIKLADKIKQVEKAGFEHPETISTAILEHTYRGCFWDTKGFVFRPIPQGLNSALKDNGIIGEIRGSTRGNPERTYLVHFVAPLAAYGNPSKILKVTFDILGLDPGIRATELNTRYSGPLKPSFWFSIGGDLLQDRILGSADEHEYRADLLGLRATINHNSDQSRKDPLSELLLEAGDQAYLMTGEAYKFIPDYQIAEQGIRPKAGHRVVNFLSRYTPIFA